MPLIADTTVIDLANRRARSKSSPEKVDAEPSGKLGAMPETTGMLRCPACHNDKFYVFVADHPWALRTTIYCESLYCDYHRAWEQIKLK